jgi:hypothetical protein
VHILHYIYFAYLQKQSIRFNLPQNNVLLMKNKGMETRLYKKYRWEQTLTAFIKLKSMTEQLQNVKTIYRNSIKHTLLFFFQK